MVLSLVWSSVKILFGGKEESCRFKESSEFETVLMVSPPATCRCEKSSQVSCPPALPPGSSFLRNHDSFHIRGNEGSKPLCKVFPLNHSPQMGLSCYAFVMGGRGSRWGNSHQGERKVRCPEPSWAGCLASPRSILSVTLLESRHSGTVGSPLFHKPFPLGKN